MSLFRSRGWDVLLGDIDPGGAQEVATTTGAHARRLDVTEPDSARDFVAAAHSLFGRIDVVVNNAGIVHVASLLDHDLEAWRRVFAINVEGALNLTQAAVPVMREQEPVDGCRGRIVNISSPAADLARPLLPAYGASKAALNHLSRTAAAVLGGEDIWVTVVYPTSVADGMWATLPEQLAAASARTADQVARERLQSSPSNRFQSAAEVAAMVWFAATAPGVNGKLLWTEAHLVDL